MRNLVQASNSENQAGKPSNYELSAMSYELLSTSDQKPDATEPGALKAETRHLNPEIY
jgi:hypothetical protein